MRSIGIVFKKNEMLMVAARHGINRCFLNGYRILPFLDCGEEEKEAVILHNLERFLSEYRGNRSNVFAALPRSEAFVHYMQMPIAAEEDLRAAISYDIDRHSPFGADDVYYDCHIVRRMPESAQLYVMLVIVQRSKVDALIELFKKLKVRLHGIELTTTALVNGHVPVLESESGFDVTAFMRNARVQKMLSPFVRRFPALEKSVAKQADEQTPDAPLPIIFPVEYLDSEHYELDVIADGALHFSRVFACQTREPGEAQLQDILRRGQQACVHLPFDQVDDRPLHFIFSGRDMDRGFSEDLPEDLSGKFSVVSSVALHPDISQGESFADTAPLLFVPAALAIKGLKPVGLDINLIPPELRPRRRKSKRKLLVAAAAGLMVALVAVLVLRWDAARSVEQEKTAATLSKLSREYKRVEARRENFARIEKLYQSAVMIESSDTGKLNILRELTEIIPEDAWLTELNYSAGRREIKLSGYALSASELLPILEQSDLFENVRFTSPITTDRRSQKEQFRLEMQLRSVEEETE